MKPAVPVDAHFILMEVEPTDSDALGLNRLRVVRGEPGLPPVETTQGVQAYDYLVIATGYLNDFDLVPGLGPGGNAYSITYLEGAVDAAEGWARFLNDPGPVVVGATQGAACFGAAYEFVFNLTYHLKKQRLGVPVAYVSAEPFPGHFGIGGLPGGRSCSACSSAARRSTRSGMWPWRRSSPAR